MLAHKKPSHGSSGRKDCHLAFVSVVSFTRNDIETIESCLLNSLETGGEDITQQKL